MTILEESLCGSPSLTVAAARVRYALQVVRKFARVFFCFLKDADEDVTREQILVCDVSDKRRVRVNLAPLHHEILHDHVAESGSLVGIGADLRCLCGDFFRAKYRYSSQLLNPVRKSIGVLQFLGRVALKFILEPRRHERNRHIGMLHILQITGDLGGPQLVESRNNVLRVGAVGLGNGSPLDGHVNLIHGISWLHAHFLPLYNLMFYPALPDL